ncbi:MAG TPA: DUF6283 family protein [Acidimicrobiales bacterium]
MSAAVHVAPRPCNTCPYVTTTPAGVWHPDEYDNLPRYDTNESLGLFLCHQSAATGVPTACRGWLSVHQESAAARLGVLAGAITEEQRYAPSLVPLYGSGREARDAGMEGVDAPDGRALAAIDRLVRRGVGHP